MEPQDEWGPALRLRQAAKTSVVKDLLRFAQVFSQMFQVPYCLVPFVILTIELF